MAEPRTRVLMVQISTNDVVEYRVHRGFAEAADGSRLEHHFVWQDTVQDPRRRTPADLPPGRNHYLDFGRDLSMTPRPSRPRRAMLMAAAMPMALWKLARHAKATEPDVVFTALQKYDLYAASALSRWLGIPHVVRLNYDVGPWLGRGVLPILRRADRLIAVSQFIKQRAIDQGIPASRIEVIPNAADLGAFTTAPTNPAVWDEFGIPRGAEIVIAVGRLDAQKGHHHLIDAFARIAADHPNAHVVICGEWHERPEFAQALRRRPAGLGIDDRVTFAGHRHDVAALMHNAAVFCLPTRNEAFGNVFTEAMASGLPIVAVDSGCVTETVVHGETGLITPLGDIAALADSLSRLLQDEELRRRMGAAGRERVDTVFARAPLVQAWADTLTSAAWSRGSG